MGWGEYERVLKLIWVERVRYLQWFSGQEEGAFLLRIIMQLHATKVSATVRTATDTVSERAATGEKAKQNSSLILERVHVKTLRTGTAVNPVLGLFLANCSRVKLGLVPEDCGLGECNRMWQWIAR